MSEQRKRRNPTVRTDVSSTEHERRAPETAPADAPQASRTQPASGDRGRGGGLGDAMGGARRATASEMSRGDAPVGDVSVQLPRGGSRTQGAAQGAGMSSSVADPSSVQASDPGTGSDTTGTDGVAEVGAHQRMRDDSRSGLGGDASGGKLKDYDEATRDER